MEHEDRQNEIERGETERNDRAAVGAARAGAKRAAGAAGKRGAFAALRTGAAGSALGLGSSALILAVTTSIALVALVTLSWLSNNREVDSGSHAMEMGGELFELAAPATLPTPTPPPTLKTQPTTTGETLTEYTIAASPRQSEAALMLSLVPDNMPDMYPGAYGTLQFYIKPQNNRSDLTVTFNLRRLIVPASPKTENDVGYAAYQTLMSAVHDYSCGHLLLFQTKTGGRYSGLIYQQPTAQNSQSEGSFSYSLADHSADKVNVGGQDYYLVTIHWVWPKNFRQMAEPVDADGDTILFPATGETGCPDASGMTTWMTNNTSLLFEGDASAATHMTQYTGGTEEQKAEAYNELNLAYNLADQAIGDNVSYLIVELAADAEITSAAENNAGGENAGGA